jgi:HEAT repeat protein
LQEFSFRRFLPAFDLLQENIRRTTGTLVAKIDPTSVEQLHDELSSSQTKRRVRALEVAAAMELVDELRSAVTGCLADDEQAVRIEAARTLGAAKGEWAERELLDLQGDESFAVREAAREAAEHRLAGAPYETIAAGVRGTSTGNDR